MTTISQRQSVVDEVKAALGSSYNPSIPSIDLLTNDQLKTVRTNIFNGIINGTIDFSKEITDEKSVSKYVSGMVSNYFRKSKELNGDNVYAPQSNGRGSRDSQISELNKLLKTYTEGTEEFSQILAAIEERKAVLFAAKAPVAKVKKVKELESINMDALPESLRHFASQHSK